MHPQPPVSLAPQLEKTSRHTKCRTSSRQKRRDGVSAGASAGYPDLPLPFSLQPSESVHAELRQINVTSAIETHTMATIKDGPASSHQLAVAVKHGKPRNLISNQNHSVRIHDDSHWMIKIGNFTNKFSVHI